jgi:hypothetical protein
MEVFQMCEPGQAPARPATTGEALAVLEGALDYLTGADAAHLPAAEQAACLSALERAASRHTAARASILAAFTAQSGFAGDGQHSARAWLIWQTSVTAGAATGAVGWMKRLAAHPAVGRALAAGDVSASWAREICGWTARLPADKRDDADRILLAAAAGGADLAALAGLAEEMHRRSCPPDAEDDGFDDRRLRLDRTFRGAGRLDADLTPACSAALAAVLDALGQKAGPEDERSKRQRDHDALEEACTRLIASGMLPERAGQPTHIQLHMTLRELRGAGDSSAAEAAWSAAGAAGYGWLTGPAAEAAACDAAIVPVVSGHVDYAALAEMTEMFLNAHGLGADCVICGSRRRGELSAEGEGDGSQPRDGPIGSHRTGSQPTGSQQRARPAGCPPMPIGCARASVAPAGTAPAPGTGRSIRPPLPGSVAHCSRTRPTCCRGLPGSRLSCAATMPRPAGPTQTSACRLTSGRPPRRSRPTCAAR